MNPVRPQRGSKGVRRSSGVNDTSPAAASQFRKLIMAKSREERLVMGCSMFDTAKQIVKDSILNQNPRVTPRRIKKEIFLRFYGMEFNISEKKKILKVWNSRN